VIEIQFWHSNGFVLAGGRVWLRAGATARWFLAREAAPPCSNRITDGGVQQTLDDHRSACGDMVLRRGPFGSPFVRPPPRIRALTRFQLERGVQQYHRARCHKGGRDDRLVKPSGVWAHIFLPRKVVGMVLLQNSISGLEVGPRPRSSDSSRRMGGNIPGADRPRWRRANAERSAASRTRTGATM